jgi:hypothetical protein
LEHDACYAFTPFCYVTPCKLVNTDISEKCSAATYRDRQSKKGSTNINSHRRFEGSVLLHGIFTSMLVLLPKTCKTYMSKGDTDGDDNDDDSTDVEK